MSKISVVMPTRNRCDLISDSIKSILSQTISDFELIIVDDHSNSEDETEKVINSFNDKRIKYFRLSDENGIGIACARNFGNIMASSDYIAVMDSDDVSYPDRLELSLKTFSEKKVDVVYGEIDHWWPEIGKAERRNNKYHSRDFDFEELKKINFIPHATVAYSRKIAMNFPYNSFLRKGEDYEFFLRLGLFKYKFQFINKSLLKYRKHDGSIMRKDDDLFEYGKIIMDMHDLKINDLV